VSKWFHRPTLDEPPLRAPTAGRACDHVEPYRLKRVIDVGLAVACLLLTAPLLTSIAMAVLLESGRPVLFRPVRLGQGGKPFTACKFRTMVRDAEAQLSALAARNLGEGMVKIPDDPRVTPIGHSLRRFSLDELPQLWNVLCGEMSIVGPRPHDISEVLADTPEHIERLLVKPGLTGLWQIRARSDPSLESRLYWDLRYVASCSLTLDVRILIETIPAVLGGRGGGVDAPNSHGPSAISATLGSVPAPRTMKGTPP
jgi:lipopolysaccharide/colanic/teichoic acid biosynthesis glycosyltransferase